MTIEELNAKYGKPTKSSTSTGSAKGGIASLWGDVEKPPEKPSFFTRAGKSIKESGTQLQEQVAGEGKYADESGIRRTAEAGATLVTSPVKVALEAAPEPVRNVLGKVGEYASKGFEKVTDKISETPLFKELGELEAQGLITRENAPEYFRTIDALGTAAATGEIAGTVAGAGTAKTGIKTAATKVSESETGKAVSDIAEMTKEKATLAKIKADEKIGDIAEKIAPYSTPENIAKTIRDRMKEKEGDMAIAEKVIDADKFKSNFNQAFPPVMKNVKLNEKRYTDAQTALTDIVKNPSENIFGKKGEVKNPKDYNFVDLMQAQQDRLPAIYKSYSSKLEDVDKKRFDDDITEKVVNKLEDIDAQVAKENSSEARRALKEIKEELSGLRDTSPEGIQNYIKTLNEQIKTAPGTPMTIKQARQANIAADMVKLLDESIDKLDGPSYAQERKLYGAHKTIQDEVIKAATRELKATPGLMEKLSNLGVSAEGINFLLTHNPSALAIALGLKSTTRLAKWMNSPERALGKILGEISE